MHKGFFRKISKKWRALCLVDRLLLTFMIILLVQSAHNLFFYEIVQQDSETLDVVIRTTAAAIFGYFISGGFRGTASQGTASGQNTIGFVSSDKEIPNRPTARIGFSAEAPSEDKLQLGQAKETIDTNAHKRIRQQLVIVSCIGLSSLIMLIIARNFIPLSNSSIATLSQLRDFVSGSVGFLIGHSGSERN